METIHRGHSSAEVIEQIFKDMPPAPEVLDLTWGNGTFWKWEYEAVNLLLVTNDLHTGSDLHRDFTDMEMDDRLYTTVVFDPPFTAQGPNKKAEERHNDRYGATRDLNGAPQNIHDVHRLLRGGIKEACRIARDYVIVKTQDVVESGKLHGSVNLAMNEIVANNFNIIETIRFFPQRRPQPNGRRVTGLGGQPSVFIVAETATPRGGCATSN
tara:strand:- start:76 stop:711 length:636 start_codon:yes stop_codon:yes gene_type:complete